MGIFAPAVSDPDLAMVAIACVIVGFILAYIVVPLMLTSRAGCSERHPIRLPTRK